MRFINLLHFNLYLFVSLEMVVGSAVIIHFNQTPPPQSRFPTAVFRYSVLRPDGSNPCKKHHNCSVHCELDGQTVEFCPSFGSMIFKNLTVNHYHLFLINVTTPTGQKNSSSYKWFIDTTAPTASISTERSYTNAATAVVNITFSEPCVGQGGLKCINTSNCDVVLKGPGEVNASTFHTITPDTKYTFNIAFPPNLVYGLLVIKMANILCIDRAGNPFKRTNSSSITIHIDRRPVQVDLWTSVPSYELTINKVSRTVLATNSVEDLQIYLDFSDPVVNSTKEIMSALHANTGNFIPVHGKTHGNRRFVFGLRNVFGIKIITVGLQSASIIGRSGSPVSDITPLAFMYDSTKPNVTLSTSSPIVTKESNINLVVEFTKPVFGFQMSGLEVEGGRVTRFKELSKSIYLVRVSRTGHAAVSVHVPAGKVNDVAGNQNLASNKIGVRQYSTAAISVALHSFVTAGLLATSAAAAVLSISSTNLAAIGALTGGTTEMVVSDPSMNLLGMVGHLQVFAFSDWMSVSLPIEYSDATNSLQWLIPREKLPWEGKTIARASPQHHDELSLGIRNFSNLPHYVKNFNSSSHQQKFPSQNKLASEISTLHENMGIDGQPLESNEYSIYFAREKPLLALVEKENYTGWKDFEMNMFWLGVASGGLLTMHLLILLFLRWRTKSSVHETLSVPRFELFLLMLMVPCISQSSAFVIRGGTTKGIIAGTLLLAIPGAFILSVFIFLVMAIFLGSRVQYKEIKNTDVHERWHTKLLAFFSGKPTKGKWFYREGLASMFLLRFGFLFEDRKGPPVFVLVDQNDPNRVPKWIASGESGIGRMRPMHFDEGNEETQVPMSTKLLGYARSVYLIIDLSRRITFGILSGAFSSQKEIQTIIGLALTTGQLLYLAALKPYIRRGVHVVESTSLVCEAVIFGLSLSIVHTSYFKEQTMGFVMLSLLLLTFLSQLVNEWYALVRWVLRFSQSSNSSFKLGLRFVGKGLILPLLPRKYWLKLVPGSSQLSTGLVPVVPLSPETESLRRNEALHLEPLSSKTATNAPFLDQRSHDFGEIGQTSAKGAWEAKQQQEIGLESRSEVIKLRELAKASFSGS